MAITLKKIEDFTKGKLFVFICAIYFFIVWVTGFEVPGLALSVLFACFLLIFIKDMTGVMSIFGLFITGVSLRQLPVQVTVDDRFTNIPSPYVIPFGTVVLIFLGISVIVHLVRFKPQKTAFTEPMSLAFYGVFFAIIFGGVFSDNFSFLITLIILALYVFLFLLYRMSKCANPSFSYLEYVALIALLVGVSATTDMFITYARSGEPIIGEVLAKDLFIGWGITNSIAPFFVLAVPMGLYLYIKTKKLPYMFFAL